MLRRDFSFQTGDVVLNVLTGEIDLIVVPFRLGDFTETYFVLFRGGKFSEKSFVSLWGDLFPWRRITS